MKHTFYAQCAVSVSLVVFEISETELLRRACIILFVFFFETHIKAV